MGAEGQYRFADYRLELTQRVLFRGDDVVALTPRSFDLLALLLKNAGNVVSKEEILRQVWGQTIVEDGTLTWHVHALRQALGAEDDSARFIETVPKRGYRFVAPLLERVERRAAPQAAPTEPPGPLAPSAPPVAPSRAATRWPWLAVVAALIIAMFAFIEMRPREPTVPYAKRDFLLLTNFENQTGEPRFDRALLTALTVSLEQSTFLNVYPRDRVAATLQRMKKPPESLVDDTLGREICVREGLRLLVAPSITRTGKQYAVAARLLDPHTGNTIRVYLLNAADESRVLDALQELAGKLRYDLGESAGQIATSNRPLAQVTTPVLGALQLYSDGIDAWDHARGGAAVAKIEAAIALDPEFAMAYAALGRMKYSVMFNRPDLGAEAFQRALALAPRTTERERQVIAADFAASRSQVPEALRLYNAYAASYPDDLGMHARMGALLAPAGRFPQAINAYESALRIDPDDVKVLSGLAAALGNSGDFKQALQKMERAIELDPTLTQRHQFGNNYGILMFAAGQEDRAIKYFEQMAQVPNQSFRGWRSLGLIAMYRGQYAAAEKNFRAAVDAPNSNSDRNLVRSRNLAFVAATLAARGKNSDALRELDQAVASFDAHGRAPIEFRARMANVYARLGRVASAEQQMKRMEGDADALRTRDRALVNYTRAEIARARGQTAEAVKLAEAAWNGEPAQELPLVLDTRARAQLESGDADGALASFKQLLDMHGRCFAWEAQEVWLLAHYELAKLYHARGDDVNARAALDPLLLLWKNADADAPAVIAARSLREEVVPGRDSRDWRPTRN